MYISISNSENSSLLFHYLTLFGFVPLPGRRNVVWDKRPVWLSHRQTALVWTCFLHTDCTHTDTDRHPFSYKLICEAVLWVALHDTEPQPLRCSTCSLPAGGAGGAAAGGDHVVFLRNTKASQVQEITDHLTFDGDIQRCVGMKAEPETQQLQDGETSVFYCLCFVYLGDMLTSRIQGLRFSSSMMSKPNSSWQL